MKRLGFLLLLLAALAVAGCGGDEAGTTAGHTYSDAEVAELMDQVAARYNTDRTDVAVYVGAFAAAGGADLDKGAMLAIMLDLPLSEYPEVYAAAGQAAWQLTTQGR